MTTKPVPGLFITGTDTGVGKTFVAAQIARDLVRRGVRVGVYKPAASGCEPNDQGELVSDDALRLWEAAGRVGTLAEVCPQVFAAPLAPHLAAKAAGQKLDANQLRTGLDVWRKRSEFLIIEGAGGLLSPLGEDEYVADIAADLGYPLLVVAPNELGVINQVLQTLVVAETWPKPSPVAAIVLNHRRPLTAAEDPSLASNRTELAQRAIPPIVAELGFASESFDAEVDWLALAR
jgi:dethiobiotin synthetase